jgi:hypothetical protein
VAVNMRHSVRPDGSCKARLVAAHNVDQLVIFGDKVPFEWHAKAQPTGETPAKTPGTDNNSLDELLGSGESTSSPDHQDFRQGNCL